MSAPKSLASYGHEEKILLEALNSERGIRLSPGGGTRAEATRLQHRLNACRAADRKRSEKMYPEGDPKRGRSAYDELEISKFEEPEPASRWFVIVKPASAREKEVLIEHL